MKQIEFMLYLGYCIICIPVLGGYHFLIPSRSGFHKIKLQKIKILAFWFFFLKKTYTPGQGINIYIKNWTNSHDVGSHKFENNWLSFGGSHQPIILSFPN